MMIGVDYPPSFQVIAFLMEEAGEYSERRLNHSDGEALAMNEGQRCPCSGCWTTVAGPVADSTVRAPRG
jgi:hypothetical protein